MNSNGRSGVLHEPEGVFDLAVRGDTTTLNELFAPCMARLQRAAGRLLSNPQDSEDALQDGLLSAVRHLDKFQGRAQFSTWMHTIVVNAAKSILRKQRRRPLIFSLDEPQPEHEELRLSNMLVDPKIGVDEHYGEIERSHVLARVLRKLPPTHRSIISLCDVEGLSMQEAARWLGLTVSAAKTRHFRANRFILNVAKEARERRVSIESILAQQSATVWPEPPAIKMNPRREATPRRKRRWTDSRSASNNEPDSFEVMPRTKRAPLARSFSSSARQ